MIQYAVCIVSTDKSHWLL
uniref:Uncharacterized protein n=1 Tax=Anguilla anguilla TaxID=7936 RepID=A0A0E9ST02_ANGAN